MLGFQDDQTQGWRIYKWGLSVKLSEAADQEIVSTESVLCTQLLALIDAQAVRKFVVHRGGDLDSDTGILVRDVLASGRILLMIMLAVDI